MLLSATLALACTALPVLADFQYQTNDFTVSLDSGYTDQMVEVKGPKLGGARFIVNDYFISPGQDPQNKTVTAANNPVIGTRGEYQIGTPLVDDTWDSKLTWTVGRHATSDTAKWWRKIFNDNETTFNDHPGSLNFAFFGTLDIYVYNDKFSKDGQLVTFDNVGIAQGHNDNGNNWWFAKKGAYQFPDSSQQVIDAIEAYDTSGQYRFTFYRGQDCMTKPAPGIGCISGKKENSINQVIIHVD